MYGEIAAQEQNIWQIEVDGVPVWITIVNSAESSAEACGQWWECGNTTTDAYLFAIADPANVRLILDFSTGSDGSQIAELYTDATTNEPLDYSVSENGVTVLSMDGYPYMRIISPAGHWVNNGRANYNINIMVDGRYGQENHGSANALTDGTVDFDIQVGASEEGIPTWQTTTLVHDLEPSVNYRRFMAWQRLEDAPSFRARDPFMPSFPYLSIGPRVNNSEWYQQNPPPINFDVHGMQIQLQSFVGFQNGGVYAVNSSSLPPNVDFETPYVFYNFDSSSRFPHLLVRGDYTPPFNGQAEESELRIRYSWKTDSENLWRYSLQLVDLYEYTDLVQIGNIGIKSVEAGEFPNWIMSKPWRITGFVEAMDGFNGEGIYYYSNATDETIRLIEGEIEHKNGYLESPVLQDSTVLTADYPVTIPIGMRGEYILASNEPPNLYLHSVDGSVHLEGAQGSLLYHGGGNLLRSLDLNGDGVLDAWVQESVPFEPDENDFLRATPGEVIEALYDVDGFLLHSESDRVTIVQSDHEQVAFTIAPPTDKESWEFFRTRLRPYESQRRDPTDLHAWLDPFPGPRSEVKGASLDNLRIIDDGFRFELSLEPDFVVAGPDLIGLAAAESGDYLVENRGGVFSLNPLAPAQLTIDLRQPAAGAPVQVTVGNSGMADVNGLFLVVETPGSDDTPNELLNQPVDALAGETTEALVTITSNTPAGSALTARLEDATGTVVAEAAPLPLTGAPPAGRVGVFDIGRAPVLWPVVGAFAVLLAAAGLMAVRRREETP